MTGALIGLESANTTLQNAGLCAAGGVCGKTDDAGEVEAKWEASGVRVCSYRRTGDNWSILGQGDGGSESRHRRAT